MIRLPEINIGQYSIERPEIIALIIPIVIILVFLIRKDFIRQAYLPRFSRFFFIFSRTLIFILLLLALSGPFKHEEDVTRGDPSVKILVDNSTSMALYNSETRASIEERLKELVNVESAEIATYSGSNIGDGILDHMEKGESILLITDGNNNLGTTLGDVALNAVRINATLNAIKMEPDKDDAAISVIGPDKTSSEVETAFKVKVDATKDEARHIIITLDDEVLFDKTTKETEFQFSRVFTDGYHVVTAVIDDEDYFIENNKFYKVIKVIPKPKVTLYTSNPEPPVLKLLSQVYDIRLTSDLSGFDKTSLGLITNNIDAASLDKNFDIITNFVTEGNGLLVVGGENSFEKGNYKSSLIEKILPVTVGSAEKKGEKVNIVITMDISKSTGELYGVKTGEDVEKALAVSAIDNLNPESSVGFIAFNTKPYVVSELSPLRDKKDELLKKVRSLIDIGNTYIPSGISEGVKMLEGASGGKNLVIISDGKSGGFGLSASLVKKATDIGITVYVIGVGELSEQEREIHNVFYGPEYLRKIASIGNGIYFRGNEAPQRIKILFGEPEKEGKRDVFQVVILNRDHFITEDLDVNARLYGFNAVIPKPTGKMLVTLDAGEPLVVIWRYGLGRITTFASDDGTAYSGELLLKDNAKLITRIVNWIIGDPERNLDYYVNVEDARVNESTKVAVKTEGFPSYPGLSFYKVDEMIYNAALVPEQVGVFEMLGAKYAVNYNRELEKVSFSSDLENVVASTGGKMFEENNIKGIAEAIVSQSKRPIDKKTYYSWILLALAILQLLFEILIRKVIENRKRNKEVSSA